MYRIISLVSLALMFYVVSCSDSKESEGKESQNSQSSIVPTEEYKIPKLSDTVKQNGYTFYIQPLKFNEDASVQTLPYLDELAAVKIKCPEESCAEEIEKFRISLLKDSSLVRREGNELKIRLKDNSVVAFKSNITGEDDHEEFRFIQYIEDLGLFVIDTYYYEESSLILINAFDGEKYIVEGNYPVVSPDRNRIVVTSSIFGLGDPDAITIFEIKNQSVKKLLSYTEGWGALEARWIDNNSLKIEQEVIEQSEEQRNKKYCKLIILPKE